MNPSLSSRLGFHSPHPFKIGLFAPNCSSGASFVTSAPERWSASWEDNLKLGRIADDAGVDFILPIGRWKGYGGPTDYQGATLETITWATALLAMTKRITVFGTVHAPLFHPIVAAKQMVMADWVSEGRFGLNIVCGWNQGEFEMFGATLREHDVRYEYAQEWLDIVLKLWGPEDDFDYTGEFFKLKKVRGKPKPYGGTRPVFMNAGSSPAGQDFAVRNCDAFFSRMRPEALAEERATMKRVRDEAAKLGRKMDTFTAGQVVCRPTREEANAFVRRHTEETVDWEAVEGINKLWVKGKLLPAEAEIVRRRAAYGMGGSLMIGTPDDVADQLIAMYEAGVRGYAFVLTDYIAELPYICAEVLPRLERKGLRTKV